MKIPVTNSISYIYVRYLFVTRFAKTGLHSSHQVTRHMHFSPTINCYTNELMIHVCAIAHDSLVCFSWGCFLRPVWHAWVLGWSSNGSGVIGQVSTWLEIATRLARRLSHQIGYCLWNLMTKLSGQSCSNFQQVGACSVKPLPFEDHLNTSDRPKKQAKESRSGNHWQWYRHGLLVHWCRNQVAVKSQACHYVCGSWLLSNPVTYYLL